MADPKLAFDPRLTPARPDLAGLRILQRSEVAECPDANDCFPAPAARTKRAENANRRDAVES